MRCVACGQDVPETVDACPRCGQWAPATLGSDVIATDPPRHRAAVGRLGRVIGVVLGANALVLLARLVQFDQATMVALGDLTTALFVVAAVLVLVWFYRVRTNVTGLGVQRRARAWTVWGWICPVVNLWFPLQIMSDIENVDLPPGERIRAMRVRGLWWACWLAAWLTAVYYQNLETTLPDGTVYRNIAVGAYLGDTVLSKVFGAAAAILLALVVHRISVRQEAARAAERSG